MYAKQAINHKNRGNQLKKNIKRFAALAAVVLWGILILTTLVFAFIDSEFTNTIFPGLIFTDIVLPIVIYAMMLVYKYLSQRS